jgi:hypothetical protein
VRECHGFGNPDEAVRETDDCGIVHSNVIAFYDIEG